MTERQYAVAIDGPSGAGKSTLARAAAEALHILYVDTGAIYRTIGVYMYRHDIAPTDAPAVIAALPEITVALRYDEEGLQRMYLNGEDVTKEIRLPMISKYASDVSAIPEVRAFLMELQRSLAREHRSWMPPVPMCCGSTGWWNRQPVRAGHPSLSEKRTIRR